MNLGLQGPAVDAAPPSARPSRSPYPPGTTNANWFGLFNAVSWQITLGAPTILYAKSLGASATVLGIIAALTPLLNLFQLPAAHLLPRYGYRRFILAGWGTRTIFIFALAVIPLLAFLPAMGKLAMVLLCLFGFNLVRGITAGAWMPWITELIPEALRGRFLSRDSVFCQVGSLATLLASALILWGEGVAAWQYSLAFLISATGGTVSLLFLKRVPDVTAHETLRQSGHRVPWLHMMRYAPFFRLMVYNLIWGSVTGGLSVFTVAFLKGPARFDESPILLLTTLRVVGALLTVPLLGRRIDSLYSRSVMGSCVVVILAALAGWWLVASSAIGHPVLLVAILFLLIGAADANFGISNSRLMMATMPLMGRNHFFALFIVITNVWYGLVPILWGLLLDGIGGFVRWTGPVAWNRYSLYFAAIFLIGIANALYTARLYEKRRGAEETEAAPGGTC